MTNIIKKCKKFLSLQLFIQHRFFEHPYESFPLVYYYKAPNNIFFRLRGVFEFLWRKKLPKHFDFYVTERIVEYPLLFRLLDIPFGSKVLVFGCSGSYEALELASIGYEVFGVDIRDYDISHNRLTFIKGDLNCIDFNEKFDAVVAISVLEHIGLEVYGSEKYIDGDMMVAKKVYGLLKENGIFILSVPFGKNMITKNYRVYDKDRILKLLEGFKIEKELYYKRTDNKYWNVSKSDELEKENAPSICGVNGVCVIKARK